MNKCPTWSFWKRWEVWSRTNTCATFRPPLFHCVLLSHHHHAPPVTHWDSIFCPVFLSLPPHSLPLSHSSTSRAVCENSSAGRVDPHTEGHSASCKHNRSYHRRKKCKQMRSQCKNVLMSDVRETKHDVGSDHLNADQPQWFLLNPAASAACSNIGSLVHLQALYGRPSVGQGGALTSEPWPWFKPALVAIDWQRRHKVKSEQNPTCSSFLVSTWRPSCTWLCDGQMHISLHRNNMRTKRQSDADQSIKSNQLSSVYERAFVSR